MDSVKYTLSCFVIIWVAAASEPAATQMLPEEPDYFLADTYARAKTLYDSTNQLAQALTLFQDVAAQDSNWCCWRSYVFMANIYLKWHQNDSAQKIIAQAEKLLLTQPNFRDRHKILENLQAIRSEMAQDTLIDVYKDRTRGFDDEIFEHPPELIGVREILQKLLEYPEDALKQGIEDTVYVKIHLSWRGTIRDVQLFKGGKLTSLKEAALRAVYKTRWKPARIRHIPSDVWVSLPVRFNLEKK